MIEYQCIRNHTFFTKNKINPKCPIHETVTKKEKLTPRFTSIRRYEAKAYTCKYCKEKFELHEEMAIHKKINHYGKNKSKKIIINELNSLNDSKKFCSCGRWKTTEAIVCWQCRTKQIKEFHKIKTHKNYSNELLIIGSLNQIVYKQKS